jgi:hypothetical protein
MCSPSFFALQRCLIDTGSPMTTSLLFHPLSDCVLTVDHSDTLALWTVNNGAPLARFCNSERADAPHLSPLLWSPAWQSAWTQQLSAQTSSRVNPPTFRHPQPLNRGSSFSFSSSASGASGSIGALGGHGRSGASSTAPSAVFGAEPLAHPYGQQPRSMPAPRVTSTLWLDEHDACHLLTVDEAGAARVWDGRGLHAAFNAHQGDTPRADAAHSPPKSANASASHPVAGGSAGPNEFFNAPRLLSSFNAFSSLPSDVSHPHAGPVGTSPADSDAAPGITAHWMPARMLLAVAGGRSPFVRLWDLDAQRCAGIVGSASSTHSSSMPFVTSLTSAWPGTNLLVAGLSNGHVNVLDLR